MVAASVKSDRPARNSSPQTVCRFISSQSSSASFPVLVSTDLFTRILPIS